MDDNHAGLTPDQLEALRQDYQTWEHTESYGNSKEEWSLISAVPALLEQLASVTAERDECKQNAIDILRESRMWMRKEAFREAERDALRRQAERYRAALEVYADPETWHHSYERKDLIFDLWGREGEHGYELARDALAQEDVP